MSAMYLHKARLLHSVTSNVGHSPKIIRNISNLTKCSSCSNQVLKNVITNRPAVISAGDRRNFIGFVSDKKDGYGKPPKKESNMDHYKFGFNQLKKEIKLWKDEMKEQLSNDPILIVPPGEVDTVFEFGKQDDIDKFIVTADSDHNEGFSHCSLKLSPAGYGLFSGVLDSTVPKHGKLSKAGYCNITSIRAKKSFQRDSYWDWSIYNTLVLRVRGDGRPYMLNIHTDGIFDITWHDMYNYVLYTRGGPHWQLAKIPFSKFFLVAKGSVQDKQCFMPDFRVSRFGITAAGMDFMDGAFNLEIDYIGLELNLNHTEEFAYEMYKVPNFIVGT